VLIGFSNRKNKAMMSNSIFGGITYFNYSSRGMQASVGQTSAQSPQSVQVSASMM